MKQFTFLSIFLLLSTACCNSNRSSHNPADWSDSEVNEWFNDKEWLGKSKMEPDASINAKELAIQYYRNQKRWDRAFAFLMSDSLMELEPGTKELDGL